jgi:pyruvate kinase
MDGAVGTMFTLGLSDLRPRALRRLTERGVDLLCLDLAQVSRASLESAIEVVRGNSPVPLCLVTEGAQVRTGLVAEDVDLVSGDIVRLTGDKVLGTGRLLSLRPPALFSGLRTGSRLGIDGGPLLRVGRTDGWTATAVVVQGGPVGSNRMVTADPRVALPPLTDKDRRAAERGHRLEIRHFALSSAASAGAIDALRRLVPGAEVVARIDSRAGVWNRNEIIQAADAVALDPVGLLREVPVERVPWYSDAVIHEAAREQKPVYWPADLARTGLDSADRAPAGPLGALAGK